MPTIRVSFPPRNIDLNQTGVTITKIKPDAWYYTMEQLVQSNSDKQLAIGISVQVIDLMHFCPNSMQTRADFLVERVSMDFIKTKLRRQLILKLKGLLKYRFDGWYGMMSIVVVIRVYFWRIKEYLELTDIKPIFILHICASTCYIITLHIVDYADHNL